MDQKSFAIVFFIVLLAGVGFFLFNNFIAATSTPTPSPSASDNLGLIFNSPTPPALQNQQNVPTPPPQQPQSKQFKSFPVLIPTQLQNKVAAIKTQKGEIDFQIYPEATKAASSFIFLSGQHFFDGLTFHRVEPGFVIQGGDPLGNGTGGPGYQFEDELNDGGKTYMKGTVAMANAGPNTNGSQFFIMLDDHPELPHNYTIFGRVTKGMDVVEKIAKGDVMTSVSIINAQ